MRTLILLAISLPIFALPIRLTPAPLTGTVTLGQPDQEIGDFLIDQISTSVTLKSITITPHGTPRVSFSGAYLKILGATYSGTLALDATTSFSVNAPMGVGTNTGILVFATVTSLSDLGQMWIDVNSATVEDGNQNFSHVTGLPVTGEIQSYGAPEPGTLFLLAGALVLMRKLFTNAGHITP